MKTNVGISVVKNKDRTWRWSLRVPKRTQGTDVHGFSKTEGDARAEAENAMARFQKEFILERVNSSAGINKRANS